MDSRWCRPEHPWSQSRSCWGRSTGTCSPWAPSGGRWGCGFPRTASAGITPCWRGRTWRGRLLLSSETLCLRYPALWRSGTDCGIIVFLNLDYGIGIKDSRINLQSSSQRANNSTVYGLSFVNEMHYLGDKGPVTVQLISEDEKFWLMQLGFFLTSFKRWESTLMLLTYCKDGILLLWYILL